MLIVYLRYPVTVREQRFVMRVNLSRFVGLVYGHFGFINADNETLFSPQVPGTVPRDVVGSSSWVISFLTSTSDV
jgi:hypothetical protein